MKHYRLVFLTLLAFCLTALCASGAGPKKKAFVYDGLILSSAKEHIIDWESLAADKHLGYVYFEVPCPVSDTALLRENVALAQAKGLKTGMCFTFTDSLFNLSDILDHLLSVPGELSQISPMISVPQDRSFERSIIHRRIQIWANVLKKHYGEQPIIKANRENCKDYLAPVLTSTYRICLVFTDPSGSFMLQHPNPYPTSDADITAYPCRVMPE